MNEEKKTTDWVRIFNKPEIGKRFRYMGYQFSMFFYFFTLVFVRAGLIEKNHPFASEANVGKYRFRDILRLAYSRLEWKKSAVPQIMIFAAVVLSIIFFMLSIAVMLLQFGLSASTAYAQTPPAINASAGPLENPVVGASRSTDLVYLLLSNIFGDTGMGYFADPASSGSVPGLNITWIHDALSNMLSIYSIAMMVIAAFIISYYLASVLLETTAEGQPFGNRFNKVWAPVRFVIALALLAPISNGYNIAQLIVFQAADWGSGFASHVWAVGLNSFGDQRVIGEPSADKGTKFVHALWLSSVCMHAWNQYAGDQSKTLERDIISIRAVKETAKDSNLQKVQSVVYTFGNRQYPDYCGSVRVPAVESPSAGKTGLDRNMGARIIQATYQDIFSALAGGLGKVPSDYVATSGFAQGATEGTNGNAPGGALDTAMKSGNPPIPAGSAAMSIPQVAARFASIYNPEKPQYKEEEPFDNNFFVDDFQLHWMNDIYEARLKIGISAAAAAQETIAKEMVKEGAKLGWGQAGAYFITLASMNGSISSAVNNGLEVVKLPILLVDKGARPEEKGFFGKVWNFFSSSDLDVDQAALNTYAVLDKASLWWNQSPRFKGQENSLDYYGQHQTDSAANNTSEDSVFGFGWKYFFNMLMSRVSRMISNVVKSIISGVDEMNPFASLSTLGLSLMIAGSAGITLGVAFTTGSMVTGLGFFLMALSSTLLMAGMALYIVVPIIPYFYFTMAVLNWAIGIFQAVVAMPLWALSFLKIDGEGPIPADANNAVIIIFRIFISPPMMVISLLGSMLVFSAMVIFLNKTFGVMIEEMIYDAGSSVPVIGVLGKAIMGIILIIAYVYMIYSFAMSIFKMVDSIPNGIIDFLGIGGIKPRTDYDDPKKTVHGIMAIGKVVTDTTQQWHDGKSQKMEEKSLKDFKAQMKQEAQDYYSKGAGFGFEQGKDRFRRDMENIHGKDKADDLMRKMMNKDYDG